MTDMRLELISIPVADVDRAIAFYTEKAGFTLDHDHDMGDGTRFVQITPPGSACSIAFGTGQAASTGGPAVLQVVVDDAGAARADLLGRGLDPARSRSSRGARSCSSTTPTAIAGPCSRSRRGPSPRGRSGGPADLEPELEPLLLGLAVVVAQRGDEALDRPPAALLERLVDGREPHVGRDLEIVEADDREVLGHVEALGPGRLEHAEGLGVRRGEDRRRRLLEREQLARQPVRHEPAVRAVALQLAPDRDARLLERAPVAVAPAVVRHEAETGVAAVADERDALVAELDQVARGQQPAGDVVDPQAGEAWVERVEQDDRRAGAQERVDLVLARRQRTSSSPSLRSSGAPGPRYSSRCAALATLQITRS